MPLKRKPAVFLDRDGELTEEKGYVTSREELVIFPYVRDCICQIHEKGYYAIVVTNQSAVARGLITEDALLEMNRYLADETNVDAVYYCPHLETGIIAGYQKICSCRKPQTGMIEKACRDFPIDLKHSCMVGDRASDIMLGKNAGIKTVLLESGYGTKRLESDVTPDYQFEDLRDLIKIL
jgi:D,D-heptose 1,7-bisphosphate phosphatase